MDKILNLDGHVVIFTKPRCPYCDRAKMLLKKKGVSYLEHDVGDDPVQREELVRITNGSRTVPQIFVNGQYVGVCDDLYALESQGKLDQVLKTKP